MTHKPTPAAGDLFAGGGSMEPSPSLKSDHRATEGRILLVDHPLDLQRFIQESLGPTYVVAIAKGTEAVKQAQDWHPDLILNEVIPSGLDEFELVQQLRAHPDTQDIPILLLFAQSNESAQIAGLNAGADDYLIKPFSAADLLARIRVHLKYSRLRQTVVHKEQVLQAQAEVARQNLENVFSRISDQFIAVDHQWRYTYINEQAAAVVGVDPQSILGRSMWDVFPDLVGTPFYDALNRAMTERSPVQFEYFYAVWQRWFENRVYPSSDGITLFVADISDRKRAEATLKTAYAELEERVTERTQALRQSNLLLEEQMAERQRAIEALQQQEQKFRTLAENSPDIIARFDQNLRYVYINSAVEAATGLEAVSFLGKTNAEVGFSAATYSLWDTTLKQVFETAQAQTIEFPCSSFHDWHTYQSRFVPEFNPSNQVEFVLVITRDVTESKQAEQERAQRLQAIMEQQAWQRQAHLMREVQEANALLDTLFNNAPIGIGIWDEQLRFVRLNDALSEINGLPQEAHIGKTVLEVLPNMEPTVMQSFRYVVETGKSLIGQEASGETPAVPGRRRHWSISYYPIHLPGNITWVGAICEEITDRKQAELAQRLLAEASSVLVNSLDYRATLTSIVRLVVATLADFCFFDLVQENGKFQRVAWHHKDPAKQDWFSQIQHFLPSTQQPHHPVNQVLATGCGRIDQVTEHWMEAIALHEEHLQFIRECQPVSILTVPLIARGRKLGVLSLGLSRQSHRSYSMADLILAEELAHRAALALDNAHLYYQAQEANRIKDEFLAVLSHELRSPLNPILGWAKLLRTRTFDAATQAKALETIERNARLQTQLIDDLLDVSRILRGKMALTVTPVSLAPIIQAAIETVRLAAEAKEIQIQTQLDRNSGMISGDGSRLQQIIWNLLSNSVKFTPSGGQIEVRLYTEAEAVVVQVEDTGNGISPDFLPHVFEYFQQADSTTTRNFGGLGLGLAIVRYLTELHGGSVQAESPGENQGSTFTVRFPKHSPEDSPEPATSAQSSRLVTETLLSGTQILVVDDEADLRDLLEMILREQGARVKLAASAREALHILSEFRPDLLITDIGMPETDGYMLLQHIRRRLSDSGRMIPAIALTAYVGEANQRRAIAAGFQQHLSKPVEPETLIQSIVQLLQNKP